jgi:preprotein translocase subunit YajC
MMFITLLAQSPAPAPGPAGGGLGFFVPLIFIFIIMYFVMIRPQKKRQDEQKKLTSNLKTGDHVVTSSGIHGMISNVKETTVMLKVADNVKMEMEKSVITHVLKSSEA